jgi:hypothetical protein
MIGDANVSETGLESMEIYCIGPTWESTRVLPSFTMTYGNGHTKVLLLGISHVEGRQFKRLVEDSSSQGQIHFKLSRAIDEPKHDVRTTFLELRLLLPIRESLAAGYDSAKLLHGTCADHDHDRGA